MSSFKTKKIVPVPHTPTDISHECMESTPHRSQGKRILTILLAVISVGFITAFGFTLFQKVTDISILHRVSGTGSQPDYVAERSIKQVNILLAGIGGKTHQGGTLTDTLMLASLDGDRKVITMLSIPRDLFVSFSGGGAGKINEIYGQRNDTKAGIENLKKKVTEITGQSIDHYLVIDFDGFIEVIDKIGGIEVDVPEDLVDRAYPNWNYGYETFSIAKGLQTLNGATALKYVRSRHSTSDYSRSERQQLVIKAIKDKVFSLGYLTNPGQISDTVNAIATHIDTDLSLTDMANLAYNTKDIPKEKMYAFNLENSCLNIKLCIPGSYLYNPNRSLFGGASVILPENATISRVSYYDDIRRFAGIIFRYAEMSKEVGNIHLINQTKVNTAGYTTAIALRKLAFPLSLSGTILSSTGVRDQTEIHVFWDAETKSGIDPESPTVRALKEILPDTPFIFEPRNLFVENNGPKIEIVLGRDYRDIMPFTKSPTFVTEVARKNSSPANSGAENTPSKTPLNQEGGPKISSGGTTNTGTTPSIQKKPIAQTPSVASGTVKKTPTPSATSGSTTPRSTTPEAYLEALQKVDPDSLPIQ